MPVAPPALVLVVRHAEKVDNSTDPVLSAAGTARAEALAEALADAKVEHVIVSQRQRTRLTAAPLMQARGLPAGGGRVRQRHEAPTWRNVAAAVRRQSGKVVLVVGHSNTVPALVHALGGRQMPDLCERATRRCSRWCRERAVTPARVVVSSFGEADPPGARPLSPAWSPR